MKWFLVMALLQATKVQTAFQYTQRPGEVLACVGGEAHFPWDYDDTRYSIQIINYYFMKTKNNLLTRYVTPPSPPEHYSYRNRSALMGGIAAGITLNRVTKNDEGDYSIEPSSPGTTDSARLKVYTQAELIPGLTVDNKEVAFGDILKKTDQSSMNAVVNTKYELKANISIDILEGDDFREVSTCEAVKICSYMIPAGGSNATVRITISYDICSPYSDFIFIRSADELPTAEPGTSSSNSQIPIIIGSLIGMLIVGTCILCMIGIWYYLKRRPYSQIGRYGRAYLECVNCNMCKPFWREARTKQLTPETIAMLDKQDITSQIDIKRMTDKDLQSFNQQQAECIKKWRNSLPEKNTNV